MRLASLLTILCAVELCVSYAQGAASKCSLNTPRVFGKAFWDNRWWNVYRPIGFDATFEYTNSEIVLGFNLFKAIKSMADDDSFALKQLPGTEHDRKRGNFWKGMKSATAFRSYALHARSDGTYMERVGITHDTSEFTDLDFLDDRHAVVDAYLEGEEARRFLHEHVYTTTVFRPLLFLFESVHRMASPAGLLWSVVESAFDPNTEKYVDGKTPFNNWPVRHFEFNTTDSAKRYTPVKLSKIYTPIPPPTPAENPLLPAVYRLISYRSETENIMQSPVMCVHVDVEQRPYSSVMNGMSLGKVAYVWGKCGDVTPPGADPERRMVELRC